MGLNVKGLMLALIFGGLSVVHASADENHKDSDYYTISKMTVTEVSLEENFLQTKYNPAFESMAGLPGLPNYYGQIDENVKIGKVISTGRDLVALGEDIYRLVVKGRPTNTTSYAPISVVPKEGGQPVDILETENWSMPVKRTYQIVYENVYGVDVVTFRYSVVYSFNGSYNGTGAYLTAVQIVPESVQTLFGFDFTATMKLGGLVNQGTKANPIAGVTLIMEYTVSTVMKAIHKADTYFVNGKGTFKRI